MIISPNTSNQVRIQDVEQDVVMFDTYPVGASGSSGTEVAVVVTILTVEGEYAAAVLDDADLDAVIAHLVAARDERKAGA